MKYLIVGLGNIGAEYEHTRHNIGFDVVDLLAKEAGVPFRQESLGDIAEFRYRGRTYVLLKPSTYMNRSGKSVRYWLQKLKLQKENMLVVLDDLNLNFGVIRLRGKGSDGGHNGLRDIDQQTGGNDYARLRIGIGSDYPKGRQADYVLSPWNEEEAKQLPEVLQRAAEAVKSFGAIGLQETMNRYNR